MKYLKLALSFVFFHSIISLAVLYTYTTWILKENDDEQSQKAADDDTTWDQNEPVVWPERIKNNVLSSHVQRSDEIDILGWWMAHEKWTVDIECFNREWGTCLKVFSTPCRVDSVRSIYQWVPLHPESKIKSFALSLRCATVDLHREASDAMYGALALVKLTDFSTHIVTIKFPEDSHIQLLKHAEFVAPADATITSVTVMLCCYGFVGTVKFTDVVLTLGETQTSSSASVVMECPKLPHVVAEVPRFKLEVLNTSGNQNVGSSLHEVTLVTQVSMDRLGILERSLSSWKGPVSLVVYIPAKKLATKSDRSQGWQKMYILKKMESLTSRSNILATLVYGHLASEEYPINYLRNVAISQSRTPFVFLIDADFLPAPEFQPKFDVMIRAHEEVADSTVWVVPAFEYLEAPGTEEFPPKTKEDLVEQVLAENSNIQPFRLTESPEAHRLTDYWQWYRAEYPYDITSYSDKYEPYIILKKTRKLPLYAEKFTGYGMNKVSHIMELFASGYKFKVLHDLWAIHLPHRTTSFTISFLQSPQKRLINRAVRYEFVAQIMRKYKLGPCNHKPKETDDYQ